MNIKGFTEDLELQKKGSEVQVGDAFFMLKRYGTAECSEVLHNIRQSVIGPFYQENLMTNDEHLECNAHLMVEYLIVGWRNLFDTNEEEVKYSRANAGKIFVANKGNWLSLNQFLMAHSSSYINYLYKQKDKDIESIKKP